MANSVMAFSVQSPDEVPFARSSVLSSPAAVVIAAATAAEIPLQGHFSRQICTPQGGNALTISHATFSVWLVI